MKHFKIKDFRKSPNGYEVHLGNGSIHHFKTLAKMKAFIAETNRFLTDSFFQINELYTQAYCVWRSQIVITDWVIFDNRCRASLEAAEGTLYNAWHKSGISSGNNMSFINQEKALGFIEVFVDDLLPSVVKRSDTYNRYKLENLKNQILLQKVKLYNYGKLDENTQTDRENAAETLFDLKVSHDFSGIKTGTM